MQSRRGFRFSIAQLMGVIVLSAPLFAAWGYYVSGHYEAIQTVHQVTTLIVFGVLLYNIRVSRWMRIACIGYAGPTLVLFVLPVRWHTLPLSLFLIANIVSNTAFAALFALGLAMTFRDVRRRLASSEDARSRGGETAEPDAEAGA